MTNHRNSITLHAYAILAETWFGRLNIGHAKSQIMSLPEFKENKISMKYFLWFIQFDL